MDWNKQNVTSLIRCFEEKPVLWDSKHADFRDRHKKHEAWKDMADKLGLEKGVVEKKTKMLIGQFQRELRKSRERKGEVYQSTWFGYNLLQFLKTNYEEEQPITENTQPAQRLTIKKDVQGGCESQSSKGLRTVEEGCPSQSISWKRPADEGEACKRPRKDVHAEFNAPKVVQNRPGTRDEYDVYGEHVACKLRSLSDRYVISTVQNQINTIIYQAEVELYSKVGSSRVYYTNYSADSPIDSNSGLAESTYPDTDNSQESETLDDILIEMKQAPHDI